MLHLSQIPVVFMLAAPERVWRPFESEFLEDPNWAVFANPAQSYFEGGARATADSAVR